MVVKKHKKQMVVWQDLFSGRFYVDTPGGTYPIILPLWYFKFVYRDFI